MKIITAALISLFVFSCTPSNETNRSIETHHSSDHIIHYGYINSHTVSEFNLQDGTRCVITDGTYSGSIACDFK